MQLCIPFHVAVIPRAMHDMLRDATATVRGIGSGGDVVGESEWVRLVVTGGSPAASFRPSARHL